MISFFGGPRRSAGFRAGWGRLVVGRARSVTGGATDATDSRSESTGGAGRTAGPTLARSDESLSSTPRTIAPTVAPARVRRILPNPRAAPIPSSATPATLLCPVPEVSPTPTTRGDASLASDHCLVNAAVLAAVLAIRLGLRNGSGPAARS